MGRAHDWMVPLGCIERRRGNLLATVGHGRSILWRCVRQLAYDEERGKAYPGIAVIDIRVCLGTDELTHYWSFHS